MLLKLLQLFKYHTEQKVSNLQVFSKIFKHDIIAGSIITDFTTTTDSIFILLNSGEVIYSEMNKQFLFKVFLFY